MESVATSTPASASASLRDAHEDFGTYAIATQWRHTRQLGNGPSDALGNAPLLALHGARSNLHRWSGLLGPLQTLGVGSLAPSLSGHGPDSPLALADTSLAQNLREALQCAQRMGPQLRAVMGSSLGGALALRVAEQHADQVQLLVLIGPALYPEAAWQAAHFGEPFRNAISVPFGFMESRSLTFLRRFRGRVLLVQGEWDGLQATDHGAPAGRSAGEVALALPDGRQRTVWSPIPAEVFSAIREAAGPRLQHIVLSQCDHRVGAHLQQYPAVAQALAQQLHAALQTPIQGPAPAPLRIGQDGEALHFS